MFKYSKITVCPGTTYAMLHRLLAIKSYLPQWAIRELLTIHDSILCSNCILEKLSQNGVGVEMTIVSYSLFLTYIAVT